MYHEEKIINDVLHWRGTPNGKWNKYSDNVLTDRFVESKTKIAELRAALTERDALIESLQEGEPSITLRKI